MGEHDHSPFMGKYGHVAWHWHLTHLTFLGIGIGIRGTFGMKCNCCGPKNQKPSHPDFNLAKRLGKFRNRLSLRWFFCVFLSVFGYQVEIWFGSEKWWISPYRNTISAIGWTLELHVSKMPQRKTTLHTDPTSNYITVRLSNYLHVFFFCKLNWHVPGIYEIFYDVPCCWVYYIHIHYLHLIPPPVRSRAKSQTHHEACGAEGLDRRNSSPSDSEITVHTSQEWHGWIRTWKLYPTITGWWFFATPLKCSSQHMESHKIPWFQSTNQIYMINGDFP